MLDDDLGDLLVESLQHIRQKAGKKLVLLLQGPMWELTIEGMTPYSNRITEGLSKLHIMNSFQSHHGRAYLFDKVVNVTVGEKEGRQMTTGMHIVCDIYCVGCGSVVGWKYEAADKDDQKYKEGKFILERFKVIGPNGNGYMIDEEPLVGDSEGDD